MYIYRYLINIILGWSKSLSKIFFFWGGGYNNNNFCFDLHIFFHWGRVLYHPFASVTIYAILEFTVDVKKNKISALTDIFVAY